MYFWNKSSYNHEKNDQELINEYKRSEDLKVLAQLYERYMHLVYGLCLKYLDPVESQDAVMQIYEKLIVSVKKYEIENFNSWLHVTSRNFCLMELRKRKREISSFSINEKDSNMESYSIMHHNDEDLLIGDLSLMKGCMEKLPPKQRECIELFYLKEHSYAEVSQLSGFELKKVKSYIQNGKRNIKICIEKNRDY